MNESLLAFVVVFLLLFFLQPFGISEYEGNKLLLSLAFGTVTFVCSLLFDYLIVIPLQNRVKTWRIWHQALMVFLEVLLIGLSNFLLSCILFEYPVEWKACLELVYWTMIIGVIITVLLTTVSYQRYMREQLDSLLSKTTTEQEGIEVVIHDNRVRSNDLHIPLNDLLYIEAQKNNVAVYYADSGKLGCREIQTTLASVLEELGGFSNVFQCHRSFLVNVNNITSARGNSNGYVLELGGGLATVPVSRTFVPKLKSYIA
ncbi:MAG: LytTR family DNA-binding domain-containing protein [Bacteroidales bacterium]|nr:LytTR family DNA-binding domain-containing protein [Bacteroidales bacterium]